MIPKASVLVAMASETEGLALAKALEARSLRVLRANSGEAALKTLREAEDPAPRLALLDEDLAGLNGLRVLARLRSETSLFGCEALVAFSASSFKEGKDEALAGGALGVLVKPLNPERTARSVAALLLGKIPRSRQIQMDVRRARNDMALDDLRWKGRT